jgi:hypothetical protein
MPALLAILPFYLVPAMGFAAGMGSPGSSEISFLAQNYRAARLRAIVGAS